MRRFIQWALIVVVFQGLILLLLAWLLPGFAIAGAGSALVAAALITVAQAIMWPVVFQVAARVHPLLVPVLSFAVAGLLILLVDGLFTLLGHGGMRVDGFWTALVVAVGLSIGATLLGALFSLRDDTAYEWFVTRPLRRGYANAPRTETPGVLFLEIDGLAEPILHQAIARGWMPTLARWLADGSHRVTPWETDLSSQTSASQAGLLLGDNSDIPAFRWYDKAAGTLMVSSSISTTRSLEQRLSRGDGLLHQGASRWNVFSGDAPDSVCTYSTFGDRQRARSGTYVAYFANPYLLPRSIARYLADVVRERWQARAQVRRDERPRIDRTWSYAFVRAATTTVMQDAGFFMLSADVCRGIPAVYVTFFAYDEVAHYSGIDRLDAFKVLKEFDHAIAVLERVVAEAPRPYHLVVLSDHGQTMGATFRQRYGQTLGELVTSLLAAGSHITVDQRRTEDWGHVNLALSEAVMGDGKDRVATRLARRALGKQIADDMVSLGPAAAEEDAALATQAQQSDAVILASGNLGLISFPGWPERLTCEAISNRFPALIPGLLAHPGIGFVLMRSETDGALALGAAGTHYLDTGRIEGEDPLVRYGENAAAHLRRTDGFSNAPDILVISTYDPVTDEVAAFEEQVGSHGGLGGPQTRPFVLHPVTLDAGPDPIVGAAALHRVMMSWLPAVSAAPGA